MRFLTLLCAVLVVVNVIFFAWPKTSSKNSLFSQKDDINVGHIRLIKELSDKEKYQVKSAVQPKVRAAENILPSIAANNPPVTEFDSTDVRDSVSEQRDRVEKSNVVENVVNKGEKDTVAIKDNSPQKNDKPAAQSNAIKAECFALGPFTQESNYSLAQATLLELGVRNKKETKEQVIGDKVFRVYLGPFNSKKAVLAARDDLLEKRVADYFIQRLPEKKYLISLGIYSTRKSAKRIRNQLLSRLKGVKFKVEGEAVEATWFSFELKDKEQVKRHINSLTWGTSSAELEKRECK